MPGKQRGAGYKLTQWLHAEGCKKSSISRRARKRWDKELFVTQMKNLRGWTAAKATAQWEAILINPAIKQFGGGPEGSPLQLAIPPHLTGEEEDASEDEESEP